MLSQRIIKFYNKTLGVNVINSPIPSPSLHIIRLALKKKFISFICITLITFNLYAFCYCATFIWNNMHIKRITYLIYCFWRFFLVLFRCWTLCFKFKYFYYSSDMIFLYKSNRIFVCLCQRILLKCLTDMVLLYSEASMVQGRFYKCFTF